MQHFFFLFLKCLSLSLFSKEKENVHNVHSYWLFYFCGFCDQVLCLIISYNPIYWQHTFLCHVIGHFSFFNPYAIGFGNTDLCLASNYHILKHDRNFKPFYNKKAKNLKKVSRNYWKLYVNNMLLRFFNILATCLF